MSAPVLHNIANGLLRKNHIKEDEVERVVRNLRGTCHPLTSLIFSSSS